MTLVVQYLSGSVLRITLGNEPTIPIKAIECR